MWRNEVNFEDLKGLIFKSVENIDDRKIIFTTVGGKSFEMYHEQDCCETVSVESIVGDLSDLIGEPILMAEESSNHSSNKDEHESCTWTFYKLATRKGYVDIRWFGSSNGYYSESVSLKEVTE